MSNRKMGSLTGTYNRYIITDAQGYVLEWTERDFRKDTISTFMAGCGRFHAVVRREPKADRWAWWYRVRGMRCRKIIITARYAHH